MYLLGSEVGSIRRNVNHICLFIDLKVRSKIGILFRKTKLILKFLSNSSKIKKCLWKFVVCGTIIVLLFS